MPRKNDFVSRRFQAILSQNWTWKYFSDVIYRLKHFTEYAYILLSWLVYVLRQYHSSMALIRDCPRRSTVLQFGYDKLQTVYEFSFVGRRSWSLYVWSARPYFFGSSSCQFARRGHLSLVDSRPGLARFDTWRRRVTWRIRRSLAVQSNWLITSLLHAVVSRKCPPRTPATLSKTTFADICLPVIRLRF